MRLKSITQLLISACEKDIEDRLWQQWLALYPNMDEDHFTSFADFKKECMKPPAKKVDAKQAIKEAEEIKALDRKGGT